MTAWLVHALTATGAVLAYMAVEATIAGDTRRAFLWLVVATLVDAVDGALARLARVKERTPQFNGARLDDIVDYLTFVFVPVFILRHDGLFPPGASGLAVASAVLLSSAYGFSREDAKTPDHFFTGFPSYWNIVAVYMVAIQLAPVTNAAILCGLVALVFVPIGTSTHHARRAGSCQPLRWDCCGRSRWGRSSGSCRTLSVGWCVCRCCTRSTTSGSHSSCTSSEPRSPRGRRPPPRERSERPPRQSRAPAAEGRAPRSEGRAPRERSQRPPRQSRAPSAPKAPSPAFAKATGGQAYLAQR